MYINFDFTPGGPDVGTVEARKPGDLFAGLGVNFQTGDIPDDLAVGSIMSLANPTAEFDVVHFPKIVNIDSNVANAGGGLKDLVMSFSTPVTSVSLTTDNTIEPVADLIRLIALEPTGVPTSSASSP